MSSRFKLRGEPDEKAIYVIKTNELAMSKKLAVKTAPFALWGIRRIKRHRLFWLERLGGATHSSYS